jgi:hypothetical protein
MNCIGVMGFVFWHLIAISSLVSGLVAAVTS